ncbi:MAG: hypothetical protein K8H89_16020 [Flavobacteriales bacterium]|jgi:hypothetical protein|nr:hypothetical protein [Flavobacteriales bacterium]MCB0757016.1 hypothetical protein [Flavobacteriales bacterium]
MHQKYALIALAAFLVSCASPADRKDSEQDTLIIGGDDASDHTENLYQMPTPNELFQIVRTMSGEGQKRMMSPAKNVERYATMPKKALNFGVYATDLVYASTYKITSEVVRYYLTCKKLGDELGLGGSFNDQDFVRLERNLTRGDSLDVISNEAYERAYRRMQDERMGPTLALVLAGGWIESMHLVSRQVLHFDASDPLVMRVAEQKTSLDHLIDMMEQYKDDPGVAEARNNLLELRDIYDTFPVVRSEHQGASPSGRMILGEDVNVIMTPEGFKDLVDTLEIMREAIIRPEDITDPSHT